MMESEQTNGRGKNRKDTDEIYIPNWLVEVLAWIARIEMANSALSTASQTFHGLCWPKLHGNVKSHSVQQLQIGYQIDAKGNAVVVAKIPCGFQRNMMTVVPIPDSPMPDYILGFHEIDLSYLDDQILAFIECIVQRCATIELNFIHDTLLYICRNFDDEPIQRSSIKLLMNSANQPIQQLINVLMKSDKTISLDFFTSDWSLNMNGVFKKLFSSDTATNAAEHNLSKQNVAQQVPAEQKVFRLAKNCEWDFIEYIKNDFFNATQPVNLFIHPSEEHAEFTLENERTEETLQLYHKRDMGGRFLYNYLVRHPSGQGAHWKGEGEKKIVESWMNSHSTRIRINIDEIGFY